MLCGITFGVWFLSIKETPLYTAVATHSVDVAEFLISKGAEIDIQDNASTWIEGNISRCWLSTLEGACNYRKQRTPLHLASAKGYVDLANLLIEKGADIHKCREGIDRILFPEPLNHNKSKTKLSEEMQTKVNHLESLPLSKTCTYFLTGSNYCKQENWICITCGFTGNKGICRHCAEHCHKGHRVRFTKISNSFYCDCGESTSCTLRHWKAIHTLTLMVHLQKWISKKSERFLSLYTFFTLSHRSDFSHLLLDDASVWA